MLELQLEQRKQGLEDLRRGQRSVTAGSGLSIHGGDIARDNKSEWRGFKEALTPNDPGFEGCRKFRIVGWSQHLQLDYYCKRNLLFARRDELRLQ